MDLAFRSTTVLAEGIRRREIGASSCSITI